MTVFLTETPGEECTLHCKMVETGCTYSTGLLVEDGTPCSDDGEHRCVNNACKVFIQFIYSPCSDKATVDVELGVPSLKEAAGSIIQ